MFGFFGTRVLSSGDHEECACEYEELNLTMNCTNSGAIQEAYDNWFLSSICNSTSDCGDSEGDSSEAANCQMYYYFVQGHHDYCPDDDIPDEILVGFHTMEDGGCEDCEVDKQYNPDVGDCPSVNCDNSTDAQIQVDNLSMYNCSLNCSLNICISSFQLIRAYHDDCEDGDAALIDDLETGIHDYEEPCEDYECNTHNSTFEFVCDEDDHDHDHSSTTNQPGDNAYGIHISKTILLALYLVIGYFALFSEL